MRVKIALSIFCLSMILCMHACTAVTIDPDLEDSQLTTNGHFRIHYTDGNPTSHPEKNVTSTNINDLDFQLEDVYAIYTDPNGDFRFKDPTTGNVMPIQIHPIDGGGEAFLYGTDRWIDLAPTIFNNPLSREAVTLHEMLHQVQWTYGLEWGLFVAEGTARMMQDKLYNDLDQSGGTEMAAYLPEANYFLDMGTDNTLTNIAYDACLFWTYFTEQYGTVTTAPQVGVDAIRVLYENYGSGSDDIQRVNAALKTLSPGTTFQDVFMNFIVANYAKDLTGTNVPAKYQYLDDNQPPGAYHRPHLSLDQHMSPGDIFSATEPMSPWSAKYYEARPGTDVPIISVDFHQPAASSTNLVYDLLVIKNDDLVLDACEFNYVGKDFLRSIANKDYDRVVVVVGALEYPTAFRYSVSTGGGTATLNILSPNSGSTARVDVHDLNTFIVTLEVVGPAGVVTGLEPDDFQVSVDGVNFTVVTGLEVMGGAQYWLVVQPQNMASGLHNLRVDLVPGITDTEMNAVQFVDTLNVDTVLVIDRSGTMLEPDWQGPTWEQPQPTDKIYGAIDAATVYVNSYRTGDKWGLVWFSTDAYTDKTLRDFNEANRVDFINELDTYDQNENNAWYATSIGDGLDKAQDELNARGDTNHDWVIVVLSDGLENQDQKISDVVGFGKKIDTNMTSPTKKTIINTVALGSNADREKLEKLARNSRGKFLYVIEPASGDLPNDLVDVYRLFAETSLLEQRIAAIRGSYHLTPVTTETITIESGATEATFVVNRNWAGVFGGAPPKVTLLDPSNNKVNPTYVDDKHDLFKIPFPQAGSWTVKLERIDPETFVLEGNYLIEVSVKSKVLFRSFLGIQPEDQKIGLGIPIVAFLTDTQPIIGADVEAVIETPELRGATAILPGEVYTIKLLDDGNHGDGAANDGIYGNTFYKTNRYGIYDMKITAEGSSAIAGTFRRETKIAFNTRGDVDSDSDGLPDTWEESKGLDPQNPTGNDGPQGDPDNDGLTNIEEFESGTDPLDPDSDDGGENDGSEVSSRKDPNDPEDDSVFPLTSLRVIPGTRYVTLVIGFLPDHDYLVVYRATTPEGPWQSFVIEPTNEYVDTDLDNDVTYYYKVVGVNRSREQIHLSTPTSVVSAMPRIDPIPPSGYIAINNGEVLTNTEQVTLNVWADPNTTEMKISNYPDFRDADWEPFDTTRNWTLIRGKGLRTLYLMLKDAAGNVGPRSPYDPSVDIQPAMASIFLREMGGVPAPTIWETIWETITRRDNLLYIAVGIIVVIVVITVAIRRRHK